MIEIIDSRQLRAFVSLAGNGSFTRTGAELHLSQSAISHAIKALETDLGCLLLDRVGKSVRLTQAGEQLFAHAGKILKEMGVARSELERLGRWGAGKLRVSASATACQHILPAVLREFRKSFPNCAITIDPADTPGALELLRAGRVDLVLGPATTGESGVRFQSLFTDELRFLVSAAHPWAVAGKVQEDAIAREHYIFYNRTSLTFRLIERHFARRDIVLNSVIALGSMEAIKELVKLNLGISILAPWLAREAIDTGSLVSLPLGRQKLKRRWGLFHREGRHLTLPEETFVSLCKKVTSQAPWAG